MTNKEFVSKLLNVANNCKTIYAYGTWGQILNNSIINAKTKQYSWWYTTARINMLRKLVGKGYFVFDCVGMIKGVLWGWNGSNTTNGGATYGSNGVPDLSANGMINKCIDVSTNFSNIVPGEAVWMDGHIGVYYKDGQVIECSPAFKNKVQITNLSQRKWLKHGKIPWIKYEDVPIPTSFFPQKGYYTVGDSDSHVELIDKFLAAKTEGGYFGTYTKFAVMAYQHINKLEEDGNIGPITLRSMKSNGLDSSIGLHSRGYYRIGDSGNNIATIDAFLSSKIKGNYYGTYTQYSVKALQTIGKNDKVYNDVIDGNFGSKTLATAKHYGFKE